MVIDNAMDYYIVISREVNNIEKQFNTLSFLFDDDEELINAASFITNESKKILKDLLGHIQGGLNINDIDLNTLEEAYHVLVSKRGEMMRFLESKGAY